MLDREKIVAVLKRRFAGARDSDIAAATNAIVGLEDEWEELAADDTKPCCESCVLTTAAGDRARFKVFRRRGE
jgi:hypothetical protein